MRTEWDGVTSCQNNSLLYLTLFQTSTIHGLSKLTLFFEQGLKMGFLSIVTDPMDEKKKDTITIEDRVGWGNKLSEQFTSLLDSISN